VNNNIKFSGYLNSDELLIGIIINTLQIVLPFVNYNYANRTRVIFENQGSNR